MSLISSDPCSSNDLGPGLCASAILTGLIQIPDRGPPLHTRLSMWTDSYVNHWNMLTNTPKVVISSPLSGLLRDQSLSAQPPQQSRPLSPLHELLHWRAKRDPKAKCFLCSPFYGRACRWAVLGELKSKGPKGITPYKCGVWKATMWV